MSIEGEYSHTQSSSGSTFMWVLRTESHLVVGAGSTGEGRSRVIIVVTISIRASCLELLSAGGRSDAICAVSVDAR
jgi:hypothetical protein